VRGLVVSKSIYLDPSSIHSSSQTMTLKKMVFTASLLNVQEIKPASSLVVSLGKALNGIASTF